MAVRSPDIETGQCDMHLASLAFGLALSLVERRENGIVVNKWEPFLQLFKSVKAVAKYVCDKKNKRYPKYQEALSKINQTVFMINLPNDTRVAGALLMIQDTLRSMCALRYYASRCTALERIMIGREQWRQLAQFEAIMTPGMKLCFDVQGDRAEIAGETVLVLTMLKVDFEEQHVWSVVNVDANGWNVSDPFHTLPMVKMTNSVDVSALEGIP